MPIVPAERAVRRARAAITHQRRRRNARGASSASAWRLKDQRVNAGAAEARKNFFRTAQIQRAIPLLIALWHR